MTEASKQALTGLRDPTDLQWYVVPLLALLFWIYVTEVQKARRTGDWDALWAGVTLFGMDFVNESLNGWILVLSGRSALWTAPGPTAMRTMVATSCMIGLVAAITMMANTNSGSV